ncbi:MAG TPA: PEPxxWA-CTERM sorting domain-containing protein, partial [Phenylobacterium sp.]
AGAGEFTQALDAGHRYSVSLISNDGLTFVTDGHRTNDFEGASTSQFDWSITGPAAGGVPEPATWSLAILGFGLAGAALRRRPGSALRLRPAAEA